MITTTVLAFLRRPFRLLSAGVLAGTALALGLLLARSGALRAAESDAVATLTQQAEKLVAEESYAQAHTLYEKVSALKLSVEQQRWVQFRLADTEWRSLASTRRADTSRLDQSREALDKMVRDVRNADEKDRTWAEIEESLGDYYWVGSRRRNSSQAWTHYRQALDWWAGSSDIELARKRYLEIIWKASGISPLYPIVRNLAYRSDNFMPLQVLQNAVKIAATPDDQARAHYLLGRALKRQGDNRLRKRVPAEFEAALKLGKKVRWYDDALFEYAQWMEGSGRFVVDENGQARWKPDYRRAVELYRRLITEFKEGESAYWRRAKDQIKRILAPTVTVAVSNRFLPRSEIQYSLNWRNVRIVHLDLLPIDLSRDVHLDPKIGSGQWLQSIDLGKSEELREWTFETGDNGDHAPGSSTEHLEGGLPVGAYVLRARAEGKESRALVLVSDAVLIAKTAPGQVITWFCNAMNGKPIPDAAVLLIVRWRDNRQWRTRELRGRTDANGLAVFKLGGDARNAQWFAGANLDGTQAFVFGGLPWFSTRPTNNWRVYAFTDRPAYRPTETVHWKLVARQYDGHTYGTPANAQLEYEILSPRNTSVKKGQLTLNSFGAAWADLELKKDLPLGAYRIQFRAPGNRGIGGAMLFRLEEYKLPEFKVSVSTPEENGRKKVFRLGDTVEAQIQAEYYFGGPVANADVEVLIRRGPYNHWWQRPHPFPWYYEDMGNRPYWRRYGGRGSVVKREKLKTDADGHVVFRIETAQDTGQGYEYTIEARVTDASRREITGTATVRVTRQSYYVNIEPEHQIFRPGARIHAKISAMDANDVPVQVEGTVRVVRRIWREVWVAPDGREVSGIELARLKAQSRLFPPPPPPGGKPWRRKIVGWEEDKIVKQTVRTDAEGKADFAFTPDKRGAYDIAWTSRDTDGFPIEAQAAVWVSSPDSTTLEYRAGGLMLITDSDTFRVGSTAPVLILAPAADRYTLFSISADDLYQYKVLHIVGTAKLLEIEVTDEFTPNVFLEAVMASDGAVLSDRKQVVVPPDKHFLDVTVEPDKTAVLPQGKVRFAVSTRRVSDGKPVAAEVAVAVADESVYAIQAELAGDPREFFFGRKRPNRIGMTWDRRGRVRLVVGPDGNLIDERQLLAQRRAKLQREVGNAYGMGAGGMGGGGLGGAAGAMRGAVQKGEGMMNRDSVGAAPRGRMMLGGAMAMPAAAAPMRAKFAAWKPMGAAEAAPNAAGPVVVVRTDFRATAFWKPDVTTGADGRAAVTVALSDSLTTWKATARAATSASAFGIGEANVRTRLPLTARLEMPRFAVVGDRFTVSAVVNNNTESPQQVRTGLKVAGLSANGRFSNEKGPETVPPSGEKRFDWNLEFAHAGKVELQVTARSAEFADAMKKTLPVYEHGIEKLVVKSGKVRARDIEIAVDIPKARRPESTEMIVQVAPSMAVTLFDALPYLLHYPYGCTEQTMSRFLPAVVVARTLRDLGVAPETIAGKMFGGIEPETADKTHPNGKHDLGELDAVVTAGLKRLADFQHGDGGWGWWKEGPSDSYMTAYVVWGLSLARGAGVKAEPKMLERGAAWLDKRLVEAENQVDLQAWMLHALAEFARVAKSAKPTPFQQKAFDNLWENRDRLNAYTRALLALAANRFGDDTRAAVLARNLENGVKRDDKPDTSIVLRTPRKSGPAVIGTAHWGEDGLWWHWSEGGVEATAFVLRALLAIDPKNALIEPVTNWLIKNRRGAQWNNTRDTAITVLALTDYLKTSGELGAECAYRVTVNKYRVADKTLTPDQALAAPSRFVVPRKFLHDGLNTVRIQRRKDGAPLYFTVEVKYFSLEEPIPPAGNEIFVHRQYYRLAPRPTLLKGTVYDRVPLADGGRLISGERVEVVLTIEAKNNYDYLVFEDLKPAGLEAVEVKSGASTNAREIKSAAIHKAVDLKPGGPKRPLDLGLRDPSEYTGRSRWVYRELRDRKIALFVDHLPEGYWEIRYTLRAEVPGRFHALPLLGYAMYVPEIKANSAELRLTVDDRPEN